MNVGLCRVSVGLAQPFIMQTHWLSMYYALKMKGEGLTTKFSHAQMNIRFQLCHGEKVITCHLAWNLSAIHIII